MAVLALVAGVLALYITLHERGATDSHGSVGSGRRFLDDLDVQRVERIRIEGRSRSPVELIRQGSVWRVTSPAAGLADSAVVRKLLSALEFLSFMRELPASVDRRELGLQPAQLRIRLLESGRGGASRLLELGSADPSGTGIYLAHAGRIFVVARGVLTDVDLEGDELLDRDVVPFLANELTSIEFAAAKAPWRLQRRSRGWTVDNGSGPVRARPAAANALVGALAALRVLRFTANVTQMERRQRVRVAAGEQRFELLLGGPCAGHAREREVERRLSGSALHGCVFAEDLTPLSVSPSDLRDRALIRVREPELARISIVGSKGRFELRRDGAAWVIGDSEMEADGDEIRGWVTKLSTVRGDLELLQGRVKGLAEGDDARHLLRFDLEGGGHDIVRFGALQRSRIPAQRDGEHAILWLSHKLLPLLDPDVTRFRSGRPRPHR